MCLLLILIQEFGGQQGSSSSSSLLTKKLLRLDVPVDSYPDVSYSAQKKKLFLRYTHIILNKKGEGLLNFISSRCQFNFVGKLLGPRGNSLKRIEVRTGCRVFIRGRGSMKDPERVIL